MKNTYLMLLLSFLISLEIQAQILVVDKSQRALIAVINLSEGNDHKKLENDLLFRNEERNAIHQVKKHLENEYEQVIYLYKENSRADQFLAAVESLARQPQIKAIDVIYYLHGSSQFAKHGGPGIGFFTDEKIYPHAEKIAQRLKDLTAGKLRVLYSDACWSSRQNRFWLNAGFLAVGGAVDIDTNMSLDLKRFVKKWSLRYSFQKSIDFSNKSIISKATDYLLKGNSHKLAHGIVNLNIDQMITNFKFEDLNIDPTLYDFKMVTE